MTTIGYVRVSTEKQEKEGLSLEDQRKAIGAYCQLYGLGEPVIYEETKSGKNMHERLQLLHMLRQVDAGEVEHVVVKHSSRLTRKLTDALSILDRLSQHGCTFHSVDQKWDTSSATGRLIRDIMLSFDEFERGRIGERTRDALRSTKQMTGDSTQLHVARAARGQLEVGRAPYGYRYSEKQLVHDEEEMRDVVTLRDWRRKGWTFSRMKTWAQNDLEMGRRGTKNWSFSLLYRICNSPIYGDPVVSPRVRKRA
jgi:DNA invertase Pin-like site-specific DNA recombinase